MFPPVNVVWYNEGSFSSSPQKFFPTFCWSLTGSHQSLQCSPANIRWHFWKALHAHSLPLPKLNDSYLVFWSSGPPLWFSSYCYVTNHLSFRGLKLPFTDPHLGNVNGLPRKPYSIVLHTVEFRWSWSLNYLLNKWEMLMTGLAKEPPSCLSVFSGVNKAVASEALEIKPWKTHSISVNLFKSKESQNPTWFNGHWWHLLRSTIKHQTFL